ncbi:MAG: cation:proton antiporter [Candidatus Syntropharchaeia archaeon]
MSSYVPLFVITLFAFLIPLLSDRIGVPAVVGEIICGIIIGKSVLGIFSGEEEGIEFLATFGFIFLMFLVGLEIDFSQVDMWGKKSFILGTFMFFITLATSIFLTHELKYGFYLVFVMSTSAVGLAVSTIRGMGMSKSKLGQTIIISAFIADFATILLLTIYTTFHFEQEDTWKAFLIVFIFLLFFGVYYIGRLAIWHFPERLSKWFRSDEPSEIGVRASFALMLVFVVLSEVLGVGAVLGAFLAGVMLSLLFRGGTILEQKLYGIGYGFLIPIFFINVGIKFDLTSLITGGIYLVPTLLLMALIVKIIPALILLIEYPLKDSISAGILLSSRLSLIIAVATVGMELGLMDRMMGSAIILLALITSTVCPTIFRKMQKA